MEDSIIIEGKLLKKYDEHYYVSEDGEVYSTYSRKFLKQSRDHDGYPRVDIHQKHRKVHQLVYLTWVGEIPEGKQVNHYDDNKENNNYKNLYCGTQKQNRRDCIKNNTNVGNVFYLTLYDREKDKVITFCPANEFIAYCGHPNKGGGINRFFSKKWFRKRYEILEFKRVKTSVELKHRIGVTTMDDECNPVE